MSCLYSLSSLDLDSWVPPVPGGRSTREWGSGEYGGKEPGEEEEGSSRKFVVGFSPT